MSETKQQTSLSKAVRNKGQYLLAIGVIASLLAVTWFPVFIVFFFGIFAYFMAKMFAAGSKTRTRAIFEFYLSANEILRNELRHWYGFEINETINRGERIIREMRNTPPLVHYALGALYNKIGDHAAAVRHLSYVSENPESFESSIVYPTVELRNYVTVLRKIERDPSEAPLTSAAVRALERGRKLKADLLLSGSRTLIEKSKTEARPPESLEGEHEDAQQRASSFYEAHEKAHPGTPTAPTQPDSVTTHIDEKRSRKQRKEEAARKPIIEVLHDIYDRNVQ